MGYIGIPMDVQWTHQTLAYAGHFDIKPFKFWSIRYLEWYPNQLNLSESHTPQAADICMKPGPCWLFGCMPQSLCGLGTSAKWWQPLTLHLPMLCKDERTHVYSKPKGSNPQNHNSHDPNMSAARAFGDLQQGTVGFKGQQNSSTTEGGVS